MKQSLHESTREFIAFLFCGNIVLDCGSVGGSFGNGVGAANISQNMSGVYCWVPWRDAMVGWVTGKR